VLISDCGIQNHQQQFSNPRSEISNATPKDAKARSERESPDRFIVKKRLISRRFFSE